MIDIQIPSVYPDVMVYFDHATMSKADLEVAIGAINDLLNGPELFAHSYLCRVLKQYAYDEPRRPYVAPLLEAIERSLSKPGVIRGLSLTYGVTGWLFDDKHSLSLLEHMLAARGVPFNALNTADIYFLAAHSHLDMSGFAAAFQQRATLNPTTLEAVDEEAEQAILGYRINWFMKLKNELQAIKEERN